jgi:hypothetical protein
MLKMKSFEPNELTLPEGEQSERTVYEAPAIVYEGQITARAGSPFNNPDNDADPAGLFSK